MPSVGDCLQNAYVMNEEQYQKLLHDSRAYINTQYSLLRLGLLEKLSKVIGLILFALVVVVLLFAFLGFVAVSLAFVLAQWIPAWAAFLIIGGVFLLQLIAAVVFRNRLFFNPMVRALSAILFAETAEPVEGEEVCHD